LVARIKTLSLSEVDAQRGGVLKPDPAPFSLLEDSDLPSEPLA
jgi:hypothetical protein